MKLCACAVLLIVLLVEPGCAPAGNPPSTKATVEQDTGAIAQVREEFGSAWNAGDVERIANVYTDNAISFPGNQATVSGRSAITKFNEDFFSQFAPGNLEIASQEVTIMGGWAFDRGTYKFTATSKANAQPMNNQGRYLVILQRQVDGSWKVVRDMDNSDTPPPPLSPAPTSIKK